MRNQSIACFDDRSAEPNAQPRDCANGQMAYTRSMEYGRIEHEAPGERNEQPSVEVSVDITADLERVWAALVTDGGLGPWMGDGATLDPRIGGSLWFPDPAGGAQRHGKVTELTHGERLQYVWWTAERPTERSTVTITLAPVEHATRVTVVESLTQRQAVGFVTPTAKAGARSRSLIGTWSWRLAMVTLASQMVRV